jgi:putative peptide zinc metalloprotease protein
MKTDYCTYPPQIAADVEVTEQRDGERPAFIIGSASVGRYIILRETEKKVLSLIGTALTPVALCDQFQRQHGAALPLATLTKFLTKLDEVGILAGERAQGYGLPDQAGQQFYLRFKLFNPDRLFTRLVPALRWVWTTEFFVFTILLMFSLLFFSLLNWAEVSSYGEHTLRDHYVAVVIVGLLIGVTHEFAHGLTCKAFGGRATEVGVLLIYYFLPALYCNVSGVHLIPQRRRRLWVIAAGVYWQLLVGTFALLAWFLLAPYTLLSDIAFIFFFGSVLDVFVNGNPLIRLDGYYFLSQWLRLPNLMDRSRAYWRGLLKRALFGVPNEAAARSTRRERSIYALFGLLSFLYTVALRIIIVYFVGDYLIDSFYLLGLLLTAVLALVYVPQPLKHLISAAAELISRRLTMETNNEKAMKQSRRLRRLVPLAVALLGTAVLLIPWTASVGNYGTLIAIPGQEAIIRAPERATLLALRAQPGEQVADGALIGRMGSFELDEQIVEVQAELARTGADYDRLLGELRAQTESSARAGLQLHQRQHDFDEINAEQRQINDRRRLEPGEQTMKFLTISTSTNIRHAADYQPDQTVTSYPPAIAVLQADIELRHAQFEEGSNQRRRARRLFDQGITARSELDAAETRAATLALELAAARERLAAALIDHQRKHTSATTDMNLARSDMDAAALQNQKLEGELRAARALLTTLEARRDLLERKHAQFELVTPRPGTVFGEELPRMVGHYFEKGAEICRVAGTRQLLLRLRVPEREIGDVRVGHSVRLKVRAFPERSFSGVVSKIGGESEPEEDRQATYRVELTIENSDGSLRPGMTAFARIEFGQQMIARILAHKIRQALRPELWLL